MTTIDAVCELIESLPGVVQRRQGGARDFQVNRNIFASVTEGTHLVLKLFPEQQEMLVKADKKAFEPVEGAWGRRGWTRMKPKHLDEASAFSALIIAWTNVSAEADDTPPAAAGSKV